LEVARLCARDHANPSSQVTYSSPLEIVDRRLIVNVIIKISQKRSYLQGFINSSIINKIIINKKNFNRGVTKKGFVECCIIEKIIINETFVDREVTIKGFNDTSIVNDNH
jgi:hypothetical protein